MKVQILILVQKLQLKMFLVNKMILNLDRRPMNTQVLLVVVLTLVLPRQGFLNFLVKGPGPCPTLMPNVAAKLPPY